jgi:hypothetical protein
MPRFHLLAALGFALFAGPLAAQETTLAEKFDPALPYRVELNVRLAGRLAVPTTKGKTSEILNINGTSKLVYDERILPAGERDTGKAVRIYRDVELARTVGGKDQKADIRPAVRRMVVLRSARGKKAPFSPDGPLTWGEIDVVRTDIFSSALVPGLLPSKAVRPGDRWPASAAAVTDLTDLDPIDEGGLTVEFVGVVTLSGKKYAKLAVSGSAKGTAEDGPSRQKLEGVGYFDLDANRLSYLNLNGTRELLGPGGKDVIGRIEGSFVMTRKPAERAADLSDAALRGKDLRPTATNTELLYDNPDLGIRFLYPRRWHVGTVQGRQLTLDEPGDGGILLTVEPPASVPTAEQYLRETREFLDKQKWAVSSTEQPRRVSDNPRLERFAVVAVVKREPLRLEYAVLAQPEGGVTVAARFPWKEREELRTGLERILKTLRVTKRIEK